MPVWAELMFVGLNALEPMKGRTASDSGEV